MDHVSPSDAATETAVLLQVTIIARRYARKFLGAQAAEDLAQDVVLQCLKEMRAGRWVIRHSLAAYVGYLVRWRRDDFHCRRKRRMARDAEHLRERTESTHVWMSPDLALEERELDEFHEQTLASLPDGCRRAYVMVREDGEPYQVVAERLGVSRAAVCFHVVAAQ